MSGDEQVPWWVHLARAAARVDWPKVMHQGGLLIRHLRGEDEQQINEDHQRESLRAQRFRDTTSRAARAAVGCIAHNGARCSCPICQEERGKK